MAVNTVTVPRRRGRPPRTDVFRPACPKGHAGRVILDGFFGQWSPYHSRPRYRCFYLVGGQEFTHAFALPFGARHPTHLHPTAGGACVDCEHELERHEGPRGGSKFMFVLREIAELLIAIGDGHPLREASRRLRQSARRVRPDPDSAAATKRRAKRVALGLPVRKRKKKSMWPSAAYSSEARLAATYLDSFGR